MEYGFPLEGLFVYLVRQRGFSLTIRDYLDALSALRLGYGTLSRQALVRLLQNLWARTEDEVRQIGLAFQEIPFPVPEEIDIGLSRPAADASEETQQIQRMVDEESAQRVQIPAHQFASPSQDGRGLPRAQVNVSGKELFILNPLPPISLRALIIAWRRFRYTLRTGPCVDLDIEATIDLQARNGLIDRPVLLPQRRNLARLVILLDVSPSMAPWASLAKYLKESILESQLGLGALYFFSNTPGDILYKSEALRMPVALDLLRECHGESALLIIGDAGAARRRFDRERVSQTRLFFEKTHMFWRPAAWINPIPMYRWRGTSAVAIAGLPHLDMAELSEDGLTRAVDVLRGKRST